MTAFSLMGSTVECGYFSPSATLYPRPILSLGNDLLVDAMALSQHPQAFLNYAVLLDELPLSCEHSRVEPVR
jgi:hypothetical protein